MQLTEFLIGERTPDDFTYYLKQKGYVQPVLDAWAAHARLGKDREDSALLRRLNLHPIFTPEIAGAVISALHQGEHAAGHLRDNRDVQEAVHHLRVAIRTEALLREVLTKDREPAIAQELATVDLEVVDYNGQGIPVARLRDVFAAIVRVAEEIARFEGVDDPAIRIHLIESGSSILVVVSGAKKVIETIHKLLKDVWARIVLMKFDNFDRTIQSLDGTVQLFERIQEAEAKGALTPEDAARIRHVVQTEMETLIHQGTALKEDLAAEAWDGPKLLAEAREVRLLGPGEK
ncbi:MAG TPA: hypothetical protein VHG08_06715 [Longimicrobium sp.]|nr:hypothetical protein [Longimicrobium sp.]